MAETADQMLARLTDAQLRAGLERGRAALRFVEAEAATEDFGQGWPGHHASRQYAAWSERFTEWHRRHYESAVADVERELARRGFSQPQGPELP